MLIIEYSPTGGIAIGDGNIAAFVDTAILEEKHIAADIHHVVSTFMVIEEFRLRVVTGGFDPDLLTLVYKGESFQLNEYGNPRGTSGKFRDWPDGFTKYFDYHTPNIVRAQLKKRSAQRLEQGS